MILLIERSDVGRVEDVGTALVHSLDVLRWASTGWALWHPRALAFVRPTTRALAASLWADRRADEGDGTRFALTFRDERGNAPLEARFRAHLVSGGGATRFEMDMPADRDTADIEALMRDQIDGGCISWISVGPAEAVRAHGAGAVSYGSVQELGAVPVGAVSERLGNGFLVRAASATTPSWDTCPADKLAEIAAAFGRISLRTVTVATPEARVAAQTPTYLKSARLEAPVLPVQPSAPDPDETAMLPIPFIPARAVPFQGATTPERLAELTGAEPPATQRAPRRDDTFNPDETLPIMAPTAAKPTGTFKDQLGTVAPPLLSLDEYVELRASLSLYGEDDQATLKRFGITSRAANSALKSRFAEYFKREPEAQRRFLDAVGEKVAALRGRNAR